MRGGSKKKTGGTRVGGGSWYFGKKQAGKVCRKVERRGGVLPRVISERRRGKKKRKKKGKIERERRKKRGGRVKEGRNGGPGVNATAASINVTSVITGNLREGLLVRQYAYLAIGSERRRERGKEEEGEGIQYKGSKEVAVWNG